MALPSLYRIAQQQALSYPQRTAVVHGSLRLDFAELADRARRAAAMLTGLGVGAGDRVVWLGQNSNAVVELLLGSNRIGAMLCVANWRQSADELLFVLDDLTPSAIFWEMSETGTVTADLRARASANTLWVASDDDGPDGYEARLAGADVSELLATEGPGEAPLLLLYTAAFGGKPNAAQISSDGLMLQALLHIPALDIAPGNVALIGTPMFHIVAWIDLIPTFLMGGTALIAKRADADELCGLLHRERPVTGRLHAPTAEKLVEMNRDGRFDFGSFRSSLNVPGWREMTARGPELGGYGQTETIGPVVLRSLGEAGNGPMAGRPSPLAEVRIVDGNGRDIADGGIGEMLVRTPTGGLGYWNRPELNAERMVEGGWWATRDLGRRLPDGTISFVAPKMQMIKTGAENVYPAEVEAVLREHPAVASTAIIGVPDPQWHQSVTAIVVLRPDADADEQALIDHVKGRIARYKAPKRVIFTDAIPMKGFVPDYRLLDERFGGGNYPGEAA
ncbi:MAG: AMP-dependent synthetase [Sphingomonas bacterium]|uniref:AMP-binding protein n=1 Tax=Sphingomonas bacterium TaxID=1895847 RepID=UPI00260E636F|nr:AMP-binding protein [Sphingomonas bacterium]MDB5703873.1 AMP-dependent synthetase [Sphingomonas bacterium]